MFWGISLKVQWFLHVVKNFRFLTVLLVLSKPHVNSSHCVSVLAAAPHPVGSFSSNEATYDFSREISYEAIASVFHQCDRAKTADKLSDNDSPLHLQRLCKSSRWITQEKGQKTSQPGGACWLEDQNIALNLLHERTQGLWAQWGWCSKTRAVLIESKAVANTSTNSPPRRRTITFDFVSLGDWHQECDFPNDYIGPLVEDEAL